MNLIYAAHGSRLPRLERWNVGGRNGNRPGGGPRPELHLPRFIFDGPRTRPTWIFELTLWTWNSRSTRFARWKKEREEERKKKKMWWIECIRNRFVLDGRTDVVSRTLTPLFFLPIVPNLYYNSFRKSFVLLFKAGSYVHKRIKNSKFCLTAIRIGVNLLSLMPKLIFFDTGERTLDLRTRIYTRNMYIYILDVYLY